MVDDCERLASPTSWFDIVGPSTWHRVFCQCGLHAGAQISSGFALTCMTMIESITITLLGPVPE